MINGYPNALQSIAGLSSLKGWLLQEAGHAWRLRDAGLQPIVALTAASGSAGLPNTCCCLQEAGAVLRQLVDMGTTSAAALMADSDFDGAHDWLAWVFADGEARAKQNGRPEPGVVSFPGCLTAPRSAPGSLAALAASVLAP